MSATDAFREEHAALLGHIEHLREVAADLPGMSAAQRADAIQGVLGFLRGHLVPHAEAEERVLYPAVAGLLGRPEATATMVSDHRAIVARIDALEAAAADDLVRLQELLYGLHALIVVHFHKEEDDYLPLLEADMPEDELAALLARTGEASGHDDH